MTQFVHLTDSKSIKLIEKTGVGIAATRIDGVRGFYCTPVSRSYYKTHQWLRELKRTGVKSISCGSVHLTFRPESLYRKV